MKKFFKENILIFIYFPLVCLIELLGVAVTAGTFYIKEPWVFLLIQFVFVGILFCISSNKARHIVASCFLILFTIVNFIFIVIFEMTETIFDFGMFKLRNDAMAILESIPVNFIFFSISLLIISCFIIFGARYVRHNNTKVGFKYLKLASAIGMSALMLSNIFVLYFGNKNFQSGIYDRLYKSNDATYNKMGITANFVNECFKGLFFSKVKLGDEQQIEDYIYAETYDSKFDKKYEDYNLVTVLVESFEWFSFIEDFDLYVNGHNLINPETGKEYTKQESNEALSKLFPNIYDFYKSSIALTNFYSREKTDISENLSLIGSYPTGAYINYDFPNNTISTSVANVLKNLTDNKIACNAFHNGEENFYNRDKEILTVGFDNFYASEQMYDWGYTDHFSKGERNLDSEMIDICADKMFPTDSQFYTHITTITMHGQYGYRDNLADLGYYNELKSYGLVPEEVKSDTEINNFNTFYYYTACVKDFDKALGKIMKQLSDRNLKDNTVVLLFGDHNTYYSGLSNYVKDISNPSSSNYTNLYRVPCMIYHPDMNNIITYVETNLDDKVGSRYIVNTYENSKGETVKSLQVKKFTCTADIVPTLFDLLGINFYSNLYFGNSIFAEAETMLYSRAYNVFVTDSIYFSNINNIKWQRAEGETEENAAAKRYADLSNYSVESHLKDAEKRARTLLEKLDICNRIFYNDYFDRANINNQEITNNQIFEQKTKSLNA